MAGIVQQDKGNNQTISKEKLVPIQYLIIAIAFSFCLIGAIHIKRQYCPDEDGRQLLTQWIFQYKSLPVGEEAEVLISGWGFSYAL